VRKHNKELGEKPKLSQQP